MPNIAAHMVIAKLVGESLKIEDDDFYRGNLLPDVTKEEDSHHKTPGKTNFQIPDMAYFQEKLNRKNKIDIGYYTHLLLDKYFLEEFLPTHIKRNDIFETGIIYDDYSAINSRLVEHFELDVDRIKKALRNFQEEVWMEKVEKNISYLEITEKKEPKYLKYEEFALFLEDISKKISKEIKEDFLKEKI